MKFQLVGDLLEETVAVHVQFRAGVLSLRCWSSQKPQNQVNSSGRGVVLDRAFGSWSSCLIF